MHQKKMWLQKMLWMQLLVLSENKFEWKFFILLAKRQMLWMPGLVLSQTSIWQNLSRRLGCHSSQVLIDKSQSDNFKITIYDHIIIHFKYKKNFTMHGYNFTKSLHTLFV